MRNFDVFSLILISIFAIFLLIGVNALKKRKNINSKTLNDIKQEILFKQGREQFKKLISKNLNIPVTML